MSAWWAHISGVSVWRVRAVGARGEGWATCMGGQGAAGCGRSGVGRMDGGSCGVMWRWRGGGMDCNGTCHCECH